VSKKSSTTFLNHNPNDQLVLNTTKAEEENGILNNQSLEEYKTKVNNKILFMEMQLKEKTERIKTLEKKLQIGNEQTKSIQKSIL